MIYAQTVIALVRKKLQIFLFIAILLTYSSLVIPSYRSQSIYS